MMPAETKFERVSESLAPGVVATVQHLLGYTFADPVLLEAALTHSSCSAQFGASYERLEFMGDSALATAISTFFFDTYPQLDAGNLTTLRAANTSTEKLARAAVHHGLYAFLRRNSAVLDRKVEKFAESVKSVTEEEAGESSWGATVKAPKVLADIVESLAAAVYLDCKRNVQQVWTLDPENVEGLVALGIMNLQTNEAGGIYKGVEKMHRAFEIYPFCSMALNHLANHFFFTGQHFLVEQLTETALAASNHGLTKSNSYYNLARPYHSKVMRQLLEPIVTPEKLAKHPVADLLELCQKRKMSVQFKNSAEGSTRTTEVIINGKVVASGSAAKTDIAKLNAARKAMRLLDRDDVVEPLSDAVAPDRDGNKSLSEVLAPNRNCISQELSEVVGPDLDEVCNLTSEVVALGGDDIRKLALEVMAPDLDDAGKLASEVVAPNRDGSRKSTSEVVASERDDISKSVSAAVFLDTDNEGKMPNLVPLSEVMAPDRDDVGKLALEVVAPNRDGIPKSASEVVASDRERDDISKSVSEAVPPVTDTDGLFNPLQGRPFEDPNAVIVGETSSSSSCFFVMEKIEGEGGEDTGTSYVTGKEGGVHSDSC